MNSKKECGYQEAYDNPINANAFSFWRGSKARAAARGDAWQKIRDAFLNADGGK